MISSQDSEPIVQRNESIFPNQVRDCQRDETSFSWNHIDVSEADLQALRSIQTSQEYQQRNHVPYIPQSKEELVYLSQSAGGRLLEGLI